MRKKLLNKKAKNMSQANVVKTKACDMFSSILPVISIIDVGPAYAELAASLRAARGDINKIAAPRLTICKLFRRAG